MPDVQRQRSSGALVFKPTIQEIAIVDTQKLLKEQTKEMQEKLQEVDRLIARLKQTEEGKHETTN